MSSEVPYNLSLQFSLQSNNGAEPIIKKAPKLRSRKVKEKQKYDILQLDEQIRACFAQEIDRIPEYKKRIISMVQTLRTMEIPFGVEDVIIIDINRITKVYDEKNQHSTSVAPVMTYREYLGFYDQLKRLITKTQNIESNELYNKYHQMVAPIIEEYRRIISIPIKTSFLCKSKPKTEQEEQKILLLDSFIRIASTFIDIDYAPESEKSVIKAYICTCGNSENFETKEGWMVCEDCGKEIPIVSTQAVFRDLDRINMHQRFKYEKKSHFKEGVYQFQGKQNKYIDPSLYNQYDSWLRLHNLLVIDTKVEQFLKINNVLDLSYEDARHRYAKITKEHLRMFLSESDDDYLTKHYEDVHLIHSKITRIPCPDISHLEQKLFDQFDKLVEAFSATEDTDRINILNSSFVLKNLLRINKYSTNAHDFPGLRTVSRQQAHESLLAVLLQKAGLNHPDIMNGIIDIPKTRHEH
jgi:hypothetical protein